MDSTNQTDPANQPFDEQALTREVSTLVESRLANLPPTVRHAALSALYEWVSVEESIALAQTIAADIGGTVNRAPQPDAMTEIMRKMLGPTPVMGIFGGPRPASCAAEDTGRLLCEVDLSWSEDKAFTFQGFEGTVIDKGVATHFRIKNSEGVVHIQGKIGGPVALPPGGQYEDETGMIWYNPHAPFTINEPGDLMLDSRYLTPGEVVHIRDMKITIE